MSPSVGSLRWIQLVIKSFLLIVMIGPNSHLLAKPQNKASSCANSLKFFDLHQQGEPRARPIDYPQLLNLARELVANPRSNNRFEFYIMIEDKVRPRDREPTAGELILVADAISRTAELDWDTNFWSQPYCLRRLLVSAVWGGYPQFPSSYGQVEKDRETAITNRAMGVVQKLVKDWHRSQSKIDLDWKLNLYRTLIVMKKGRQQILNKKQRSKTKKVKLATSEREFVLRTLARLDQLIKWVDSTDPSPSIN